MNQRSLRPVLAVLALVAGWGAWWSGQALAPPPFAGFVVATMDEGGRVPHFVEETVNESSPQRKAHSASLARQPDGSLVVVWYAGHGEGAPDVGIWLAARSADGQWGEPREIMTREGVAAALGRHVVSLGNPVLLEADGHRLGLLFVSIAAGRWSGSSLNLAWSDDGGQTWGPLRKLTTNPLANLSTLPRNPPVRLLSGGWAVPVYEEFIGRYPEILWLSAGAGAYGVSRVAGGMSVFQPALAVLSTDRAEVFLRDGGALRRVRRATTGDAGRSWTRAMPADLPNADSGLSVIALPGGRLLAAFNDSDQRRDRQNLRLALSDDGGATWTNVATLAEEEDREFSYPYLLAGPDDLIRIVYSSRRNRIAYAEFNLAWLEAQQGDGGSAR